MSRAGEASGMTGLQDLIRTEMRRHNLVGVAVAVVGRDGSISTLCEGPKEIHRAGPITPDTVFEVASITKTMTAICLLQLHQQGKFGLDEPVNAYLRSIQITGRRPEWPAVSFRHLLTHTSGLGVVPRWTDLLRKGAAGRVHEGEPAPALTEVLGPKLTTEVPAGSKWSYSNHGFAILGQLVEDISGEPLREYMRQHLFEPLGMTHSDLGLSAQMAANAAAGHTMRRGQARAIPRYTYLLPGAGAVCASIEDMGRYVEALLGSLAHNPGAVLSPSLVQLMCEPHYQPDERLPAQGLAFRLEQIDCHRIARANGNHSGFCSSIAFAPEEGVGVTVLSNTRSLMGAEMLATSVLESVLGVEEPAAVASMPRLEPALRAELAGVYHPGPGLLTNSRVWELLGGEIEIRERNGNLVLRSLSRFYALRHGVPLRPAASGAPLAFEVMLGKLTIPIVFNRDTSGKIASLATGGLVWAELSKRPQWASYRRWARVATFAGAAMAVAAGIGRLRSKPRAGD